MKQNANIKTRLGLTITAAFLVIGAASFLAGCATSKEGKAKEEEAKKEERVSLERMSQPARATVLKETAGGRVESIVKEVEKGRVVYDVEATVGGKHFEYLIADSDGEVLGTEVPIQFSELPEPVRAAAEKLFGTTSGLTVMKGVEYGETSYEIEGKKDGKTLEASFDPSGKRLE